MSFTPANRSVCAILLANGEPDALAGQTRPVDERLAAGTGPHALRDGLRRALGGGAEWFWLLGRAAAPTPTALECLLAPLASPTTLPAPAILAGRLVDADGAPAEPVTTWPRLTDKEVAVAAAEHGLVSIRAARQGSLLVHRRAVEEHGLPRVRYEGWGDDIEWTARLLEREAGYLVPGSIAVRRSPGVAGIRPGGWRRSANAAEMLIRGPWRGQERIWFGLVLARELAHSGS